jgi:site-specific recombinase XerD
VVRPGGSAWESNPPKTALLPPNGFEVPPNVFKLLNKLSVTRLAELSNFSKSYISQVKRGKCPPSQKLLRSLHDFKGQGQRNNNLEPYEAIQSFLKSRREGLSPRTLEFYEGYLKKAVLRLGLTPSSEAINSLLNSLSCSEGGKHAYFRALRAFYRWLYSPRSGLNFRDRVNPMIWIDAPKVPNLILPSLTLEQVLTLIDTCPNLRDKAVISLFTESGLRLSELANIKSSDIDWQNRIIRVLGKGKKEAYAPFGELSAQYLKAWLTEFQPNNGNIWGLNKWGIEEMLKELKKLTSLPCNPHTFRRTFACLLRKTGVDTMTIKDLGRWESLEMVQRYTRSITFQDSLKFYKAPLG